MTTLEELLKFKQPKALDEMQEVANSTFADKFAKNPMEMTAEQIDALNADTDLLDKVNKAKSNVTPKAVQPVPSTVDAPIKKDFFEINKTLDSVSDPMDASEMMSEPTQSIPRGKDNPVMGASLAEEIDDMHLPKSEAAPSKLAVPVGEGVTSSGRGALMNDFLKQKTQNKMGEMVGSPKYFANPDQIKANVMRMSKTPNASGALAAVDDMASAGKPLSFDMEKYLNLPEEQLANMPGKLGEVLAKLKASKAGQLASKAAPALGGLGAALELGQMGQNLNEGKYIDASGNTLGAISGMATMAGMAPLAAATGAGALGVQGGAEAGRQMAEYGVDENGMPVGVEPKQIMPEQEGNAAMLASAEIPPTSGIGPTTDGKYNPLLTSKNYGEMFGPPAPIQETQSGSGSSNRSTPSSSESQPNIQEMLRGLASEDGFSNNTVENLKRIQEEYNKSRDMNQGLKIANQFAAGLVGGNRAALKPDQTLFNDADKLAEDKVKQFEEMVAKEGDDPESKASKKTVNLASEMLQKAGFDPKLVRGMSYNQIQKNFPQITNMMTQKLAQESRADLMKLKQKEIDSNKEKSVATKERGFVQGLRKELTNGKIGEARALYDQGKRAEQSLQEFMKNPTGYTDYGTLMLGLKTLQGDTSVVREAEITLGKNAASMFTKAENALQEAATGKSLQKEQRQAIVDSLSALNKASKNRYLPMIKPIINQAKEENVNLNSLLDPDEFPEFFQGKNESDSNTSVVNEDEEAIEWAKENRNDPDAKEILKLHGIE